ncbi:MAG: hypothetical protein K6G94_02960 [Kiritimatiellae bacterium]|nr:hypothetical protein [Kiritimatiellia bacterium]
MKKILTILAATATMFAFGAANLDTTISQGADFEAFTAGNAFSAGLNDSAQPSAPFYWYTADTDAANIISNYTGSGTDVPIASRPEKFADDVNSKYLQVETTGKLYRTVKNNGGSDDFTTNVTATYAHSLTEAPIYLDTLVKFTAADSVFGDDALADGDKIAIEYVEHESEGEGDDTVTNFVIRAGFVTGTGASATVVQTNYFVAPPSNFDKDAWHRLTVRTISDVGDGTIGFVIYLDQALLKYSADVAAGDAAFVGGLNNDVSSKFYNDEDAAVGHALFPSVVRTGAAKTTISAAAFSGNGSLDDVVFTTTKPEFIQETALVTVRWDTNKITAVTLNSTGLTQAQWEVGEIAITPVNNSVVFSVTYAEGYELGTCSVTPATSGGWDGANAFTNLKAGAVCDIGAIFPYFQVGNKYYENVADAIAAALVKEGANYGTLKLVADYAGDIELSDSGNIIIDLAGKTITGTEYGINNGAANLIITNSTAEIGHVTGGSGAVIIGGGTTTIYGGSFDAAIAIDSESFGLTLFGGKFLNCPEVLDDPSFYLNSFVDGSVTATAIANKYFQVGGGDTPQPTTYALTLTVPANVSVTYKIGDGEATAYTEAVNVASNATVTITAAPAENYTYTNVELGQGWTLSEGNAVYTIAAMEAVTAVTVPTPDSAVIGTYQVTVIPTNNTSYAVTGAASNEGDVYTVATGHSITITATPDSNYEYATTPDGWTAGENGVITKEISEAGTVEIPGPTEKSGKTYPSYITDATAQGKYDAWATANNISATDFPDTGNAYQDAYLLNCAPDAAVVAAEKAAFKFTSISYDTTQSKWVTTTTVKNTSEADYNGTVVVKQYSDVGCTTESSTGTFFKAFLQ